MPTTKAQKFLYAFLTVMITVPLFVFYNLSLEMGGMSNQIFVMSLKVIPVEFIFALALSVFVASPLATKIAFSIVNPREEKPYIITLAIICSTVTLMCPMMSLISAILFHGITTELIAQWMQNIVINFPFAFFSQIFFVQPIVRTVFKAIVSKKESQAVVTNLVNDVDKIAE
jgi:hypothetical protein